jgi:hypothetical protein
LFQFKALSVVVSEMAEYATVQAGSETERKDIKILYEDKIALMCLLLNAGANANDFLERPCFEKRTTLLDFAMSVGSHQVESMLREHGAETVELDPIK